MTKCLALTPAKLRDSLQFLSGYRLSRILQQKLVAQLGYRRVFQSVRPNLERANCYDRYVQMQNIDSIREALTAQGRHSNHYIYADSVFLERALAFVKKYGDDKKESKFLDLYYSIGFQYDIQGNMDKLKYWMERVINQSDTVHPSSVLCAAELECGILGVVQNDNERAIVHYTKAMTYYNMRHDTSHVSLAYSNIAGSFLNLYAYKSYQENQTKALMLAKELKDTFRYLSYATIHNYSKLIFQKDTSDFIATATNLHAMFKEFKGNMPMLTIYMGFLMTDSYIFQGNTDSATFFINRVKVVNDSIHLVERNEDIATTEIRLNYAKYHRLTDEKTAQQLAQKYAKDTINSASLLSAIDLYQLLNKNAIAKKDYKAALDYKNAENDIKDFFYQKTNDGKVFELEKKYQTAQKEAQIRIKDQDLKEQKTLIALLIASLGAILLGLTVFSLWQRQKRAQRETANQVQFTQQLFQNTEDERGRIARDLHDGVSHELMTLKRSLAEQTTVSSAQKIDTIINDIRQISRNLHPVLLESIGLKISLESLCDQFGQNEELFVSHDIDYHKTLSPNAELQLFRIVQEALNNVEKYAQAEAANVHIFSENKTLKIEIKDNGKGFDVEKALNGSKAFGLHSVLQRSKAINGDATIQSSDKGTVIKILVPEAV